MAFSDGVFAVAITLLVFNVPVPAIAQSDAMSRLPDALLNTAPPLLTFALSFFLVGFYWIRHHQLLRQVISADQWLLAEPGRPVPGLPAPVLFRRRWPIPQHRDCC